MLTIKSEKAKKVLKLPTEFNEVTKEVLDLMTANIKLAPNYCIIAMLSKARLDAIGIANNNRTENNISVVPILAKFHEDDKDYFNKNGWNLNDRVMIAKTDIEMSLHLDIPNNPWSLSYAGNFCRNDEDLLKSILDYRIYKLPVNNPEYKMNGGFKSVVVKPNVFVNFKIVPINNIQATYDRQDFEGTESEYLTSIRNEDKPSLIIE